MFLQRHSQMFHWKIDKVESRKHCLCCADITDFLLPNEYDSKVPHKNRMPASFVTTDKLADGETPYKDHLLEICEQWGDELAHVVRAGMLGTTSDLHAADARYHRKTG